MSVIRSAIGLLKLWVGLRQTAATMAFTGAVSPQQAPNNVLGTRFAPATNLSPL